MDKELLNLYIENWDSVAEASVKAMEDLVESKLAIQRIRDLHTPFGPTGYSVGLCTHCSFRPYPCPTILALGDEYDNHSGATP